MYAFQDKGNLDDLSKNKHVSKETRVKYRKFLDLFIMIKIIKSML
jgi:hypothetical protein